MRESDLSPGYQELRCNACWDDFFFYFDKLQNEKRLEVELSLYVIHFFPFLFSLAFSRLSGSLSLTQSTVGLNNIRAD